MAHMTSQAVTVFFFPQRKIITQRLFIIAKYKEINLITNKTGVSVSFAVGTVLIQVRPAAKGLCA